MLADCRREDANDILAFVGRPLQFPSYSGMLT
jgi:hypothetical protein